MKSVEKIQELHAPAEIKHSVIAVKIDRAISEGKDVYEAARKAWKLSLNRANQTSYLLAVQCGVITGVFIGEWGPSDEGTGRLEFVGKEASQEVQDHYLWKRLPEYYYRKDARNPVRYLSPSK